MGDAPQQRVDLPRTAAAWRQGRFEDLNAILDDEVADRLFELTDGMVMDGGGWPDDAMAEVESVDIAGDSLTAKITIDYSEMIPSACADQPYSEHRRQALILTMDRGDNSAVVTSPEDEDDWTVADWNSAGDGA